NAIPLAAFWIGDLLLLAALPWTRRSFGPANPPTLLLAVMRGIFAWLPSPWFYIIQSIGTILVIYAFWIEPFEIQITRQTFVSPNLSKSEKPLRLLHIGDLHIERLTQREIKLNALIQDLNPDIILFSGDFLNLSYLHDERASQDVRRVVSRWIAPLGVFAVSGSPAVDLPGTLPDLLSNLPITVLENECKSFGWNGSSIHLFGLSCSHHPQRDAEILAGLNNDNLKGLKVLLYHSPDIAPDAAELGMDLQLSGHTHGGQVRLPLIGALFTGSLYGRAFQAGRYQIQNMVLYITRGLGMEGAAAPRVRFLCKPEITLWEINGSQEISMASPNEKKR
ncbi:MAG: hypothetical protein HGA86_05095, partial [Anaerolineaceae bacterium]|nr:hypothetical protein [Anaerolineaceae bacterium]